MEHVLMLGNGFDLYYKLPTKYNNFLQIVSFLSEILPTDLKNFETVGDILSAYTSSYDDGFVALCYATHQELYDSTTLPHSQVDELLALTKNNIWFRYLLKSFNKDVGWIDFEKEISNVINALRSLLQNIYPKIRGFDIPDDSLDGHIVRAFDFSFFGADGRVLIGNVFKTAYRVKAEYLVEYPLGSGNLITDSAKIISVLSTALYDLSEALKLYLSIFAESIIPRYFADNHFRLSLPFQGISRVITFNYTNTYEHLYKHTVHHLHGRTDGKIVLGINPDKYDEVADADTLCIAFKKYYQRVMYGTDTPYQSWIRNNLKYTLMIMGHSLDVTDADIITELFSNATEITIIYHDDASKSSYIGNIIKMYGKSGFDKLRKEKKLEFRHIDSDFSEIIKARPQDPFYYLFTDESI